jgi:hypothetical protein
MGGFSDTRSGAIAHIRVGKLVVFAFIEQKT